MIRKKNGFEKLFNKKKEINLINKRAVWNRKKILKDSLRFRSKNYGITTEKK